MMSSIYALLFTTMLHLLHVLSDIPPRGM